MAHFRYLDNNKVQIIVTHGRKFDGTPCRYYKTVNYSTKKQLEADAAIFLADVLQGRASVGSGSTIDIIFKDFMSNRGGDLKQSTLGRYKTLYANQIAPYFATKQINKLNKVDIRNWVKYLNEKGNLKTHGPLSQKTIRHALSLLSTLYNYAIYDLDIMEKNPCEKIRIPKTTLPRKKKDLYDEKELVEMIDLLLQVSKQDYTSKVHSTMIFLVLFTGLRTGEAMGLTWNHIDYDSGTIKIEAERVYVPMQGVVNDTTKTLTSNRTITIPPFLLSMLNNLRSEQEENRKILQDEYEDSGYVSSTVSGTAYHPRSTYKWFKNFLRRHNLRDVSIHDLRHTHAAMLSGLGFKILDVSKRMGHSNTRVTQEVYEYLFRDLDNSISDTLENYFEEIQKCC